MAWIFALGIIALAVFHRGFRIVLFWIVGVALVFGVGVAAWTLYQAHESNIERVKAHAALRAKENAFRLALSRYCSTAELGKIDSAGWIPLEVTAGATPEAFAREEHCAGSLPTGSVPTSRGAHASKPLPAWATEVEQMEKHGGKSPHQ